MISGTQVHSLFNTARCYAKNGSTETRKKEQKKIFTVLSVFESVFRDLLLREASTDIYAVVVEDFMGGACPRSFHSGVQTVQKARYGKVEGMEGIDENGDGERFQLTEIFDEHASKYRCTRAKGDVAHFSKFRSRSPAFERYTRGARSSVPQTGWVDLGVAERRCSKKLQNLPTEPGFRFG